MEIFPPYGGCTARTLASTQCMKSVAYSILQPINGFSFCNSINLFQTFVWFSIDHRIVLKQQQRQGSFVFISMQSAH